MVQSSLTRGLLLSAAVALAAGSVLWAQSRVPGKKGAAATKKAITKAAGKSAESDAETQTPAATEAAATTGEIVIHRQPLHLRAPERYQVLLHLEPHRTIRLAAPRDGVVKDVIHKAGDKVQSAAEIVHLDLTEKQLLLTKAKALYKAAQLEATQAVSSSGGTIAKQLADARTDAAKADLDLAQYWVEQGTVRAPFEVEIFGVGVSEGQVVRIGETLVTVGETSILKVELPVDRNVTTRGQSLQVKVEDKTVSGKVESILPLASRFESLRELLPSAASAMVLFENSDSRLKAGQTVFAPLIPRDPVAEVSNSSIGNIPDGSHKVQVLRDNVVRDVPITALAAIGADRSFVSGPFGAADELVASTSQELTDGTVIRAAAPAPVQQGSKSPPREPGKPGGTETPAEPTARPSTGL